MRPQEATIRICLDDGSFVEGDDWSDAAMNLARSVESDQRDLEAERLRSLLTLEKLDQYRQATGEKIQNRREPDSMAFDKDRYVTLLNSSDPEEVAQAGDLWYQHRFGMAPDEAAAQMQTVAEIQSERIGNQFLATHPEFPQGDAAAAKAMRDIVDSLMQQGYPYDSGTLHPAYDSAVRTGHITPKKVDVQPTAAKQGSGEPEPTEAELWTMPMDKLEKFAFQKRG